MSDQAEELIALFRMHVGDHSLTEEIEVIIERLCQENDADLQKTLSEERQEDVTETQIGAAKGAEEATQLQEQRESEEGAIQEDERFFEHVRQSILAYLQDQDPSPAQRHMVAEVKKVEAPVLKPWVQRYVLELHSPL